MKRRELTRIGLIAGIVSFFGFPKRLFAGEITCFGVQCDALVIDTTAKTYKKAVVKGSERYIAKFEHSQDGTEVWFQFSPSDVDNWKRDGEKLAVKANGTILHNTEEMLIDSRSAEFGLYLQKLIQTHSDFEIETIILRHKKDMPIRRVYRS